MRYLYNASTICEICGKDIATENKGNDFEEVEISHEYGESWESDHNSEGFAPCICGECFRTKIYPFLKGLGVKSEYVSTSDATIE